MARERIAAMIDAIIEREGGAKFTDHAADRGGPTKFGITQGALAAWRGRPVTRDDVAALERAEAWQIYWRKYVAAPGFADIHDDLLAEQVIDAGVNHGPVRAARWLQTLAGVAVDGDVGPITLRAVNGADGRALNIRFASYRIRFYGRLIAGNARARRDGRLPQSRDQALFASGWMNRATEFLDRLAARFGPAARP
jgi:lysozyme family protein